MQKGYSLEDRDAFERSIWGLQQISLETESPQIPFETMLSVSKSPLGEATLCENVDAGIRGLWLKAKLGYRGQTITQLDRACVFPFTSAGMGDAINIP